MDISPPACDILVGQGKFLILTECMAIWQAVECIYFLEILIRRAPALSALRHMGQEAGFHF